LFSNRQFKAKIDKIDTDVNGTFSVRARLEGFQYAWCLISTSAGKSFSTIDIPEKNELFVIRYLPETGKYYLLDIDKTSLDAIEGSPSLVSESEESSGDTGVNEPLNNPNSQDTVSVMIVYTPAAASYAATYDGGINNTISQIMQKANLSLGNSNTLLYFNLVYSGQVDYTELNTSDDLVRLTNTSDG